MSFTEFFSSPLLVKYFVEEILRVLQSTSILDLGRLNHLTKVYASQLMYGEELSIKNTFFFYSQEVWMNLENSMLSEISQSEKDKHPMISLICVV